MVDETTKEEEKPTVSDTDKGDKPESLSPIEQANETLKRMEEANKESAEILRKQEDIRAREMLGGRTELSPPPKEEEISPRDYAEKALRGEIPTK